MKPLAILAAAALALLWARRSLKAFQAPTKPDADDSEVVGMPTTWSVVEVADNDWTLGPGWYVQFAPTSLN